MAPKVARFTARQMINLVESKGFSLSRQSGSHMIFHNTQGIRVTIPKHTSKILHPKIVKLILRDIDSD